MSTQSALESLSMDLIRLADCIQRGSLKTGERFRIEALRWHDEINLDEVEPHFKKKLLTLKQILQSQQGIELAQSAHLYSTLLHHYLRKASK